MAFEKQAPLYHLFVSLFGGALKRVLGYTGETASVDHTPFLLVANHNTDLDPCLVALSFKNTFIRFVASEHAFRKGIGSTFLRLLGNPIARVKGSTDAAAVMQILRTLRGGTCVGLFAEGNRSFNGVTGAILPATGKLARSSGAALVTYRIEGGYLTTPRWSRSRRKGKMLGYVVNVYTPEMLRSMSPDEINAAIQNDINEDAFLRQAPDPVAFRGKNLAEGIERALFLCPRCGRFGTLIGKGNDAVCSCGFSMTYTETGVFAGENLPFENIRDFDLWQTERMNALADGAGDEPVFSDENTTLLHITAGHTSKVLASGRVSISKSAFAVGDMSFPLRDMGGMAIVGASTIVFSVGSESYSVISDDPHFAGRKYNVFYHRIRG